MNTKKIGTYKTWFEYHPANRVFDQFVEAYGGIGGFYHSLLPKDAEKRTFAELPFSLSDKMVKSVFDMITKHHGGGRFLMQDYRSGDWFVLTENESIDYIKRRLLIGGKYSTALGSIQDEIDVLLDTQRFGLPRNTLSMSWNTQLLLLDLSKKVVSAHTEREHRKDRKLIALKPLVHSASGSTILPRPLHRSQQWKPIGPTVSGDKDNEGYRRFLIGKGNPAFRPGMEIWLIMKDTDGDIDVFGGTVININYKKRYRDRHCRFQISLEGEGIEALESEEFDAVSRGVLKPRKPITSGDRITVDFDDGSYMDGTILLVMADGSADVAFDNGETVAGVGLEEYVPLDAVT